MLKSKRYCDNYSKGCQLCQQGKWICIFLTYLCNAKCNFCPAPFKQEDKIISAFGNTRESILSYLKNNDFSGISFSGGDCFLVFDRLLEWLTIFRKHHPESYYWAYTNGLAVDEHKLNQLAGAGLNEIRFNIAATNYNNNNILQKIKLATNIIQHVAVEIPSIPADCDKLLEVIPILEEMNVNYLNLHEYIIVPSDQNKGTVKTGTFTLNKQAKIDFDTQSLSNTEKIKQFCRKNSFNLKINNCSLEKKDNQMFHRRLVMGNLYKKKYEKLTSDGLLKTYLLHPSLISTENLYRIINKEDNISSLEKYFTHPDLFNKNIKTITSNKTIAELYFLPALSIDDKKALHQIRVIKQG